MAKHLIKVAGLTVKRNRIALKKIQEHLIDVQIRSRAAYQRRLLHRL
jgi:hypothetical protein